MKSSFLKGALVGGSKDIKFVLVAVLFNFYELDILLKRTYICKKNNTQMKISKILLVLFVAVSVLSCKKDDGGDAVVYTLSSTNFADIYSLNFLEIRVSETVTFSNGTTSTSTTTTVGSVFQDAKFTMDADGTYTTEGLFNTVQTVVLADGTTVVDPIIIENAMGSGTYNLNVASNILILTDENNDVTIYEITLYSETEMRLFSESEFTLGNSAITSTSELRFSRS
jgi:hypothetical protein